ncbi:hypothetical protein [Oryzomonas rubra]|uniref:Uncharacterized protein n=1 Tax=Oryzomonas rubra TaxID=2509454 RepID=A0A5A9XGM2_9BACT|nr:hypothetical protein [Oryzomonas rubra]KAA0891645.1 hypothetical protein ET418_09355 [Oryzomonas rubra]
MANKVNYNEGEFSYLTTSERLTIGDKPTMEAANKYFSKREIPFRRYGFDNSTERPWEFPNVLRHGPDLTISIEGKDFFCEGKGVGSDNILKVRADKIESYKKWEHLLPLKMFIYNSSSGLCAFIDFTDFLRTLKGLKVTKHEKMGRIFEIPCSRFNWEKI